MSKILLLFIALHLFQDVRVATFSTGTPDSSTYESLSFWIKGNKRAYIRYSHGKEAEDIELSYQGIDYSDGKKGIKALFPDNKNIFYIVPAGDTLQVTDKNRKHLKFYLWEDEARNADSTSNSNCSICAVDGKDAIGIVRDYFLK